MLPWGHLESSGFLFYEVRVSFQDAVEGSLFKKHGSFYRFFKTGIQESRFLDWGRAFKIRSNYCCCASRHGSELCSVEFSGHWPDEFPGTYVVLRHVGGGHRGVGSIGFIEHYTKQAPMPKTLSPTQPENHKALNPAPCVNR